MPMKSLRARHGRGTVVAWFGSQLHTRVSHMKRIALTIPVLALGVWGYAEFRPPSSNETTAGVANALARADTGRVVMRRLWKIPPGVGETRQWSMTADGRYITVGGGGRQKNIRLLDLTARKIIQVPAEVELDGQRFTGAPISSRDGEWLAYHEGYASEGSVQRRLRIAPARRLGAFAQRPLTVGTLNE